MTLDSTGVATSTNPFTLDISANELDLEGHELSSLDAQLVAKWLPKSSVTRINLCHNPAFSDPTQFVAMFQDSESKLRSLCGVKEGTLEIDWATHSISRADLIILSAELKLSRAASGIQSLDLSQTHLDEDGGAVLAEALASKQVVVFMENMPIKNQISSPDISISQVTLQLNLYVVVIGRVPNCTRNTVKGPL